MGTITPNVYAIVPVSVMLLISLEIFRISLTRNRRNLTVRVKSIIALGNKLVIILFIFPFCIYWLHYSFLLINTWTRNLRFDNTWCNIILHNLHDGKKWFEKITCTGIFVFTDVSRMLEKKEKKKKIRKIEYILI